MEKGECSTFFMATVLYVGTDVVQRLISALGCTFLNTLSRAYFPFKKTDVQWGVQGAADFFRMMSSVTAKIMHCLLICVVRL